MKLTDVLTEGRIRVGVSATTLEDASALLLRAMDPHGDRLTEPLDGLAGRLAAGETGSVIRANDDVLLAAVESPEAEDTMAALGVFPHGFSAPGGREGDRATAKVLLLLVTRFRVQSLRAETFPRLARAFRTKDTTRSVLAAATPAATLQVRDLMDTDLFGALLVSDALSPVSYRIYPDTPLPEVLDLMARRGVQALPVVGPAYEVLGLISSRDALGQMVKRIGVSEGDIEPDDSVMARDVMSRSVLCVEEDQTLLEAARLMVNKGFERLPVVRSGELIGFVTEETALRMLSGALHQDSIL